VLVLEGVSWSASFLHLFPRAHCKDPYLCLETDNQWIRHQPCRYARCIQRPGHTGQGSRPYREAWRGGRRCRKWINATGFV